MIILHYVTDMSLATGIVPEYVNRLVHATEQVSTNHIITASDLDENVISFRKDYIRQLELINPDIVHIHASWDYRAAMIALISRRRGYFVVVSPHGGLSPESMDVNFWKDRMPKLLLYQIKMIKNSNMLVVTSEQEKDDLIRLKWKQNIAVIPHPVTSNLSDDELRTLVQSAYRKVIDTYYRKRLKDEEKALVNKCIKASVWNSEILPSEMYKDVDTDGLSFRRIFLYIYDEHVTDDFISGAKRLGINIPPLLDVKTIDRFRVKEQENKRELKKLKRVHQILEKLTKPEHHTDINQLDLQAYLKVYSMLRFQCYDEDEFVRLAKKNGIYNFSRKLMGKCHDMFQLETGFMPLLPQQ